MTNPDVSAPAPSAERREAIRYHLQRVWELAYRRAQPSRKRQAMIPDDDFVWSASDVGSGLVGILDAIQRSDAERSTTPTPCAEQRKADFLAGWVARASSFDPTLAKPSSLGWREFDTYLAQPPAQEPTVREPFAQCPSSFNNYGRGERHG